MNFLFKLGKKYTPEPDITVLGYFQLTHKHGLCIAPKIIFKLLTLNQHFVTGKTMKSILISCAARLAPFDIKELREITTYDEMDIENLGERKTALFMIMSDTDDTYNFLMAILDINAILKVSLSGSISS